MNGADWQKAELLRGEEAFGEAAALMVRRDLVRMGIEDERVLTEMRRVPRHTFVSKGLRGRAYDDCALPTLNGQTISQPYIVAYMTERLEVGTNETILEIGTGSGYQTMILARLARQVVTIERDAELAAGARALLAEYELKDVEVRVGDGTRGAADAGPFEGIIVTAAAPRVPEALKGQLAEGGRLVIPVGDRYMQTLRTIRRVGDQFEEEVGIGCCFVPLVGEHGW